MAVTDLDMSTLAETSQGVAFEFDMKNPSGHKIMTPTRARLEARQGQVSPRCLKFKSEDSLATPVKEVAEKAKERNDKRAEAVERIRQKQEDTLKSLREAISTAAEQAAQKRSVTMSGRSEKAGKHFESVIAKVGENNKSRAEQATEHQKKITEVLEQSSEKRSAKLAETSSKASEHTKSVSEKVAGTQRQFAEATAEHDRRLKEAMELANKRRESHLADKIAKARSIHQAVTIGGA
mmetsp:Transcript_98042/g.204497  ORF Transcript_98042/g.204497 Transcript_98042/m.204497 type:complete len:237 (-) Transcript_98042:262-972(-)|eukprot:CAMPEP_0206447752 /NCGR_PEP_ID=MMETSP0324_2-20121206/17016_1 /ASSEMBLY_ACC=CAM_ASM_000836 /TAXON_ID=2866 /ORGANISM="Crypthecodinium cohnii, Strain Seligo" /LENGTH=236 /DNA_ID=CAMNT_0053916669 /DNA_START=92 /DNA_END=802 /DNA_ORIENTATION=+